MSFSFNNKKILMILNHGGLGGTERQAFGLAKYLTEEKACEVKILQLYSNFQTEEYKKHAKQSHIKEVLHFGPSFLIFKKEWSIKNLKRLKWSFQYLWKVRQGIIPYKPDVIIPFLNVPSKLAYYLYKLLPSVKVTFWHQLGADTTKGDWFETFAAYNIPFVIGNAHNCFELFKTKYKIPKSKLNLLPQYLTLERVDKDGDSIRSMLNIPVNAVVIGMIAQYRSDKYFDLLLDAYYQLVHQLSVETHLVILGNKKNNDSSLEIYKSLKEKVKLYKLENHVSVLSNFEVNNLLNIIDIGVLVSQIEGMPNTVMEYMSYGIPVVATNHPGCEQLLDKSNFLIPNDIEVLKDKLAELINSKELRDIEGKRNAKKILDYNVPDYVYKLEQIINKYL
ncbi:glycosyltransferase [Tamlana sp. 2201CG12-4]|uniref:glycosyltransferase n=1 Tax=Tamlana sp. 2201CG12-4 TaxID=3112582 RepID=UPI002DBB300F|nr:glycosyltransferase [Tamlana sp. 2201CG12-4]MEC3907336.1 glycosyltransferase [Tamlana sp. 2201CG12-4]